MLISKLSKENLCVLHPLKHKYKGVLKRSFKAHLCKCPDYTPLFVIPTCLSLLLLGKIIGFFWRSLPVKQTCSFSTYAAHSWNSSQNTLELVSPPPLNKFKHLFAQQCGIILALTDCELFCMVQSTPLKMRVSHNGRDVITPQNILNRNFKFKYFG